MSRLIDADALYNSFGASGNCGSCQLDAYKCQYYNEHTLMEFCERIDDAPTVDPVKHGHWLFYEEPDGYYHSECSECGQWCDEDVFLKGKWHYCPHCGAKMDRVVK